jgi:2-dehydro-3-deoxygluconokinase
MYDIVTFGEAMIRLSPPNFQRLEQTTSLEVQVGGGEYNVAINAARLGLRTAWVSRLPDNPLGRMIANRARQHGVDTSHIIWTKSGRAGLYFVEMGAAPRPSSVLYDRAGSDIAQIQPGEVPWAKIFAGSKVFHVSGITPALSESAANVTLEALEAAKLSGLTVSYDLNYRKKLWNDQKAEDVQTPMMRHVDILITTEEDTEVVFKINTATSSKCENTYASVSADTYKSVAAALKQRFGFKAVAITLRENPSVWKNMWTAIVLDDKQCYEDRKYELEIVDRLGGGDSFSAGLLYGFITKDSVEYGLRFGNACAALKHSNPSDTNWCTREEVESLMRGSGVRVVR